VTLLRPPGALRLQLQAVKHCLEDVQETMLRPQYPGGDHIETRAARCLLMIEGMLSGIAAGEAPPLPPAYVDKLKCLQRRLQDIAILACCRFMNQRILQKHGIPDELKCRLQAAFGPAALEDESLWSRLGNSKYHIFTPEKSFKKRKRWDRGHGRSGGRKSRRPWPHDEAPTEAEPWSILVHDELSANFMTAASSPGEPWCIPVHELAANYMAADELQGKELVEAMPPVKELDKDTPQDKLETDEATFSRC